MYTYILHSYIHGCVLRRHAHESMHVAYPWLADGIHMQMAARMCTLFLFMCMFPFELGHSCLHLHPAFIEIISRNFWDLTGKHIPRMSPCLILPCRGCCLIPWHSLAAPRLSKHTCGEPHHQPQATVWPFICCCCSGMCSGICAA